MFCLFRIKKLNINVFNIHGIYYYLIPTMDKILRDLFNDGTNDGDITITCQDKVDLKCHSLIMKSQSDFFRSLFSYSKDKQTECTLLYDSKVVKLMINRMYNSHYPIPELTLEELLEFIKLADELLIIDREYINKNAMFSFKLLLTKDNWLSILKQIYNMDIYAKFVKTIMIFFRDNILVGEDFVANDPLKDVNMNSEMGKQLCLVMREKIAYFNKKLGYYQPHVKKPEKSKQLYLYKRPYGPN